MSPEEIKTRSALAQFHGPYRAEGTEVRQANFHPTYQRGYMLCCGVVSEPVAQSIADTLNYGPKLIAAIEAVLAECQAEEEDVNSNGGIPNLAMTSTFRVRQLISDALR